MESSDSSQFYDSHQRNRGEGLGFFCCLMSYLTLCPKIPFRDTPTSRNSVLDPHGIFLCSFLLGPPSLQVTPGGSEVKVSACNAGDLGSIPGSGRSPGEGNGNPLQYSCLENPTDGGAWWPTVYGVAKSGTRLSDFSSLPSLQALAAHTLLWTAF